MRVKMIGIKDSSQHYGINTFRDCEVKRDEGLSKLVGMPMILIGESNGSHSVLSKNIVFISR